MRLPYILDGARVSFPRREWRVAALAKILIVDDDPQFRRVLRLSLSAHGHEIAEAGSGAEALSYLRQQPAELVLLDWQMPGLDGLQTCRAIRSRFDIPVMIVTAREGEGNRERALAAGAVHYLTKPFQLPDLLAHISSALCP